MQDCMWSTMMNSKQNAKNAVWINQIKNICHYATTKGDRGSDEAYKNRCKSAQNPSIDHFKKMTKWFITEIDHEHCEGDTSKFSALPISENGDF